MSYQKRKNKRSKIEEIRFRIGLFWAKFFKNRIKRRKEKSMKLIGVKNVADFLRARSRLIRRENPRLDQWVDAYLGSCLENGRTVNILTPWCLSKAFERRINEQSGRFFPMKKERMVFEKEIPQILKVFSDNGFSVNWWLTLNRSYLESRQISEGLEKEYLEMIKKLAYGLPGEVLLLDWEKDILGCKSGPEERLLRDFNAYVKPGQFKLELERWIKWREEQTDLKQSDEELAEDVKYQIACEAKEGFLLDSGAIFGPGDDFILMPLESPERFDNFSILAPFFKKRLVPVLSTYPWRI